MKFINTLLLTGTFFLGTNFLAYSQNKKITLDNTISPIEQVIISANILALQTQKETIPTPLEIYIKEHKKEYVQIKQILKEHGRKSKKNNEITYWSCMQERNKPYIEVRTNLNKKGYTKLTFRIVPSGNEFTRIITDLESNGLDGADLYWDNKENTPKRIYTFSEEEQLELGKLYTNAINEMIEKIKNNKPLR